MKNVEAVIKKLIKKHKKIVLFSHKSPDPDTIGSTLALFDVLKINKTVFVCCDELDFSAFSFIDANNIYNCHAQMDNYLIKDCDYENDLAIAVDVASLSQLGNFAPEFLKFKNTIKIDHHQSSENYAMLNLVKPYSACAIIIYEIIKSLRYHIDGEIASLLYFGIVGDTGIFKNNNTDVMTFEICAKLLKLGADYKKIYSEFFDKKTISGIKLTSKALLDAYVNEKIGYAILTVTKNDFELAGAKENENLGNLPKMYLSTGLKIGAILKENDGEIHVSFRSKFEYDCSIIAEKFGGGGHKNAAGCSIDADIISAKNMVVNEIEKYLDSQAI